MSKLYVFKILAHSSFKKMNTAIKNENKQKESQKQEPQKNEIKKSDTQTKKVEGKAINKK